MPWSGTPGRTGAPTASAALVLGMWQLWHGSQVRSLVAAAAADALYSGDDAERACADFSHSSYIFSWHSPQRPAPCRNTFAGMGCVRASTIRGASVAASFGTAAIAPSF